MLIGLRRQSNAWKWTDGSDIGTNHWKSNPNQKDCAKAKADEAFVKWEDHECHKEKEVACSYRGLC